MLANFIKSEDDILKACAHLKAQCPNLARVIEVMPPPPLRLAEGGFIGLARIIVFQQISIAAGNAIWAKFTGLTAMTPEAINALTEDELRLGGLSRPKIRTLKALSKAIIDNALTEEHLQNGDYDALTAISGIGPWTVEIYKLSCVGDADVFPSGDLALQEAIKDIFLLENRPSAKEAVLMVEHWKPYRAVASRLLWAHYTMKKNQ